MNERGGAVLRQETVVLSHFNYEVPALYVADTDAPFFPVVELCRMVGIQADKYMARWRRQFLWHEARKLPVRTATQGIRLLWCLHAGALLSWLASFDWEDASPERQEQLQQATDALMRAAGQAHRIMLERYQTVRHCLFEFLTVHADTETRLRESSPKMHVYLNDFALCIQYEEIVARGQQLIKEATSHARAMLQEQQANPIIDAVSIDADHQVVEEFSLPLFPVVSEEDVAKFFAYVNQITAWFQELNAFLDQHQR